MHDFILPFFYIFAFNAAPWFAEPDDAPHQNSYILNFAKDQKDKPTKRWLKDLFSTHLGETCSYRPY